MKFFKVPLLSSLFFFLLLAGCGSVSSVQNPPTVRITHGDQVSQSPAPITLQVTRRGQVSQPTISSRSWTITNAHAIQQLLDEIQRLPAHHNVGADTCARPFYLYTLDFWAGTTILQKDELYSYCLSLTAADGSEHDPTTTFYSLLTAMLHLSKKELLGW